MAYLLGLDWFGLVGVADSYDTKYMYMFYFQRQIHCVYHTIHTYMPLNIYVCVCVYIAKLVAGNGNNARMYMRYVKSDDDITNVCGLLVVEFLCCGLVPSVILSSIAMNMVKVFCCLFVKQTAELEVCINMFSLSISLLLALHFLWLDLFYR